MPDQPFVAASPAGDGHVLCAWNDGDPTPLFTFDPKDDATRAAQAALWLSTTNPRAARDLLGWANLPGGWGTGGFIGKLLDSCANADDAHLDLLARGYPAHVAAYRIYGRVHRSPELLERYVLEEWAPEPTGPVSGEPEPGLDPNRVLDLLSDWLCYPDEEGQWRSACDFIEFAAGLVAETGRSTDPVVPA